MYFYGILLQSESVGSQLSEDDAFVVDLLRRMQASVASSLKGLHTVSSFYFYSATNFTYCSESIHCFVLQIGDRTENYRKKLFFFCGGGGIIMLAGIDNDFFFSCHHNSLTPYFLCLSFDKLFGCLSHILSLSAIFT